MSVNKIIAAIDPRNMHDAVMNKMDRVAVKERSTAGKVLVKAPALVALSATALVTNVAAAVTETFNLLGKLALAGVKYGVMKPIRVITWSNAFESVQAKMPDGKSLLATTVKVAAKVAGIFYSVTGLVAPTFNLRRQEELGNFVNQRKADEANKAVEAAKAAEAKKQIEAQKTAEAKKALADLETKMKIEAEKAKKELKEIEELRKGQEETKKVGVPVAKLAAAVARGTHAKEVKAKEAQKTLGHKVANDAVKVALAKIAQRDARLADIAYLEQFAVAEELKGDRKRAPKEMYLPDADSKWALIQAAKAATRLNDIQYLEQFAVAEALKGDRLRAPKTVSPQDINAGDRMIDAQRQEYKEEQFAAEFKDIDIADAENTALPIGPVKLPLEVVNARAAEALQAAARAAAAQVVPVAAPVLPVAAPVLPVAMAAGHAPQDSGAFFWNGLRAMGLVK